ncbi:MAG TPA: RNA polymerase sigma factor [Solirubrobacteraceae bacterium]|jgi:RNA polymerase sigma-70 factor (ECF subfamily)
MDENSRRGSFETLFAEHYVDVRGYVLRRSGAHARSSVDDAVAETFLVAWRRIEDIGPDPLPWLLGVARRVLANQRRGDRRRLALADQLRRTTTPNQTFALAPELSDRLRGALLALSPREREALMLVAWEGLSPERAAHAAGCSAAAFRVRLHRARRHLASHLDAAGELADGAPPSAGWPTTKETTR